MKLLSASILAAALLAGRPAVLCPPLIPRAAQLTDDGLQLPMAGTLAHGKDSSRAAGLSGRVIGAYFTACSRERIKNR